MRISNSYIQKQNFSTNQAPITFKGGVVLGMSAQYRMAKSYADSEFRKLNPNYRMFLPAATFLKNLDTRALEGIAEGIKVLDGVSMDNIKMIFSNQITRILLKRGCQRACSHCLSNATIPRKSGNYLTSMPWGDFTDIVDGFAELAKRLNTKLPFKHKIQFIGDAEPLAVRCFDREGKPHNIAEAIEYLHDRLDKGVFLTTSGYDLDVAWQREAAMDLAALGIRKPESVSNPMISLNPFNELMGRSIKAAKQGKLEESRRLREAYTDRLAAVMRNFYSRGFYINRLGLPETGLKHPELRKYYDAERLCSEAEAKLKQSVFSTGVYPKDGYRHRVEINDRSDIANLGRAGQFFAEKNDTPPPLEVLSIDANGHVLLNDVDFISVAETGIHLNTRKKDVPTHGSWHFRPPSPETNEILKSTHKK